MRWRVFGRKATSLVVILGALVVALPIYGKMFYAHDGEASSRVEKNTLANSPIDPSWIISGVPTFRSNSFDHSFGTVSGIWECDGPGKFIWKYNVNETIYILSGSAEIDYLGNKLTVGPGDTVRFYPGTTAIWNVPVSIRKTYRIERAGLLTSVAIRIARLI